MVEFLAPGRSGESADRFIGGLGWKSPLELIAPDLLLLETASALRKLAMLRSISDAAADRAVSRLPQVGIATITTAVLLADAWALRKRLTIYDAVYVALNEVAAETRGRCDRTFEIYGRTHVEAAER